MNAIDELIELADETTAILRRLAFLKRWIGNVGAPADIGEREVVRLRADGGGMGAAESRDAPPPHCY